MLVDVAPFFGCYHYKIYRPIRLAMLRSLSNCLCIGMNLSCLAGRCASVVRLGCWSLEWILQGESSHAGSIRTTRNGFGDVVAQVRACKIVLRMSVGSYSRVARQDPVQR